MTLKHRLEVLQQEELTKVHDASIKILEETGIVFHLEEAVEICKKHGARVEGKTVFFSRTMIESALEKCPSTFKWRARNDSRSVTVGEGFLVQPAVGPVYIQDFDTGRRLATLEDFSNIQKLCQASDVVDLVGASAIDPSDIPAKEKHLFMMYETIRNSDKPVIGYSDGGRNANEQLDLLEMSFGQKDIMKNNCVAYVSVSPLSPLAFAGDALETIIAYARRNQAVALSPGIMAGVTGPISLLGTAVLQNAEILAGIVLIQSVNPGNPVIYSPVATASYLKKANFTCGTPETMLINIAALQMARNLYHMPTRNISGVTEAKVVDCQAGYETMQNLMMAMLGGGHIMYECLGILDQIMAVSYEKMIIDQEIINRVKRIWKGIDTSDKALSVDVIQEVGHMGTYLTHQDTFEQFRNQWQPSISDWDSYEDWTNAGSQDVVTRANKKYKEILQNTPESLIDPELDKELKAYINKATGK